MGLNNSFLGMAGRRRRQRHYHKIKAKIFLESAVLLIAISTVLGGGSVADIELVGTWQGSRIATEFLPNHTFKRDGLYLKGMKWKIEGRTLSQWNPEVADTDISPTTQLPGLSQLKIVSVSREKLVLENRDGIRFVEYRLSTHTEVERESAAKRARADTATENERTEARVASDASPELPSALQRLMNSSGILTNREVDASRKPTFLRGDFDGDGKLDYAIGLKQKKAERDDLAILFGGGKVRFVSSESSIGHNYPGPDWSLIPKLTRIMSRPEYNDGRPAPALNADAISLERPESSAAVLYWQDGRLRLYWVAD